MSFTIMLIEDDTTIRDGIAYLIDNTEGFRVTGQYSSFNEAAGHLESIQPDVILLDVELPGINGIEAILEIRKKLPSARVIILTVYENEKTIFRALRNGANGYLTKNLPASKITAAIKEVMEGGAPMSPGIAKLVIQSFHKSLESPLSKRETEVLENIAVGKSRGKIASELFIDLETVKSHIKSIYLKLNVNSKEEAIKIARQKKII
jgi:DNA-binding NarL/FixJ family response regulator